MTRFFVGFAAIVLLGTGLVGLRSWWGTTVAAAERRQRKAEKSLAEVRAEVERELERAERLRAEEERIIGGLKELLELDTSEFPFLTSKTRDFAQVLVDTYERKERKR